MPRQMGVDAREYGTKGSSKSIGPTGEKK